MRLILSLLIITIVITYFITYLIPVLKRRFKTELTRIDESYNTNTENEEENVK